MNNEILSVRQIEKTDIHHIVNYWKNLSNDQLETMGIDPKELYVYANLAEYIAKQIDLPIDQKSALYIIGLSDGEAYGHCYVNGIVFGKEAHMHLHVWNSSGRKQGRGSEMVKKSIPYFFERLELKNLFCETYHLNIAPNKTIERLGFEFEKCYTTSPSGWSFTLKVNRWKLTKNAFRSKYI